MKLQLLIILFFCIACNIYINKKLHAEKTILKHAISRELPKLPATR